MPEFRKNKDRDPAGRVKLPPGKKGLSKGKPWNKEKKPSVRRKNPIELAVRRRNVSSALIPYLDRVVRLTLMAEGNKKNTGWFFVLRIEFPLVVLRESQENFDKQERVPVAKELFLQLEKVYYIFDGQKGIWPQRQSSVNAWHSK